MLGCIEIARRELEVKGQVGAAGIACANCSLECPACPFFSYSKFFFQIIDFRQKWEQICQSDDCHFLSQSEKGWENDSYDMPMRSWHVAFHELVQIIFLQL